MPDRFNAPRILFSDSATDVIKDEVQQIGDLPETGGVLVGRRLNSREILVIAATGPGPQADHQRHTFAPDTRYANRQLRELRGKHKGTDFIGVWHKHPPNLDHPSGPDWGQAREILLDPDYATDEIVAPIVTVRRKKPHIKVYYVHKRDLDGGGFIPVEYEEVELVEAERRLQQAGQEYSRLRDERLNEEFRKLSNRYEVSSPKKLDDGSLVFVVQSAEDVNAKIYLICPTAYPQAPPRVMIEQEDAQKEFGSSVVTDWTEDKYLVEVVEEAEIWFSERETGNEMPPPSRPQQQDEPVRPVQRPEILAIGAILALVLCVASAIVARPFLVGNRDEASQVAKISATPEQVQTSPSPLTPQITTPTDDEVISTVNLTVVPKWGFKLDGTGSVTFNVRGGAEPYTYLVDGQDIEGPIYPFKWACQDKEKSLQYEVRSNDGQTVKNDKIRTPVPTCTPTPTTPIDTPTPRPTPTSTDNPFSVPDALKIYDKQAKDPIGESFVLKSKGDCFTMRFTIKNNSDQPVRILQIGASVLRNGRNQEGMFQKGTMYQEGTGNKFQGDTLDPSEVVEVWVKGKSAAGMICGVDLYKSDIQTGTLELKAAVNWDKWAWPEDPHSVKVQYQP